jgi:heme-degrading monooxygenase HmoA
VLFLALTLLLLSFLARFRNISRILDCVSCEKCRLWGKLQILGIGTAIKILLTKEEDLMIKTFTDVDEEVEETRGYDSFTSSRDISLINRQEIIALINTLNQFSKSIEFAAVASHEKEKEASAAREAAKKMKPDTEKSEGEFITDKRNGKEARDGSMSFVGPTEEKLSDSVYVGALPTSVPSLISLRRLDRGENRFFNLLEIDDDHSGVDKQEIGNEGFHRVDGALEGNVKSLPVSSNEYVQMRSNLNQVDDDEVVYSKWETQDSSNSPISTFNTRRSSSTSTSSSLSFLPLLFLSAVITVVFPLQIFLLVRNYCAHRTA